MLSEISTCGLGLDLGVLASFNNTGAHALTLVISDTYYFYLVVEFSGRSMSILPWYRKGSPWAFGKEY